MTRTTKKEEQTPTRSGSGAGLKTAEAVLFMVAGAYIWKLAEVTISNLLSAPTSREPVYLPSFFGSEEREAPRLTVSDEFSPAPAASAPPASRPMRPAPPSRGRAPPRPKEPPDASIDTITDRFSMLEID